MSMTLRKLVSLKVRIEYSCTAPYVQNVCTKKVLTTAATPDSMIQPALDSARLPALQPASSLLTEFSVPLPLGLSCCWAACQTVCLGKVAFSFLKTFRAKSL